MTSMLLALITWSLVSATQTPLFPLITPLITSMPLQRPLDLFYSLLAKIEDLFSCSLYTVLDPAYHPMVGFTSFLAQCLLICLSTVALRFGLAYAFRSHCTKTTSLIADASVSRFRQDVVNQAFTLEGHFENPSNDHKVAARRRSAARHWITTAITRLGLDAFSLNLSTADLHKGAEGERILRTPKDHAYYKRVKTAKMTKGQALYAVDDIDHMSFSEFNTMLSDAAQLECPVFSYMHAPTSGGFMTDEYEVVYDPQKDKWVFTCPGESTYEQQLWNTNGEIVSTVGFRNFTRTQLFLVFCLALVTSYFTFVHFYSDPAEIFRVAVGPWEMCYKWTVHKMWYIDLKKISPPVFNIDIHGTTYVISCFSRLWMRVPYFAFITYPWPTIVTCPPKDLTFVLVALATIGTQFSLLYCSIRALRLQSSLFFAFRVDCGQDRIIWVLKPCVRFGLIKTLWFAKDVTGALPTRVRPSVVNVPDNDLQNGSKLCAMTHIDQKSGLRVYTYNIVGSARAAILDTVGYNIIRSWNLNQKKMISPSTFAQYYGKHEWTTDQLLLMIQGATLSTNHARAVSYTRSPNLFVYTFRPEDFGQENEVVLKPYFDGCILGATYVPAKVRENMQHSIATRIVDVRPVGLPPAITRKHELLIQGFIREYKVDTGPAIRELFSDVEVDEKQTKPSQRIGNEESGWITGANWLEYAAWIGQMTYSFLKIEAAMKAIDPRNITVMPDKVRQQNSRIALPLAGKMKKTKWYSFGISPAEVARRVAEHINDERTKDIALGDFSRMDGTVNHLVREFDRAFLRASFHPSLHEEIDAWYEQTYNNCVNAGKGVWYEQDFSQASGDPYTSALNTARAAFILYCCLRASTNMTEAGCYMNLGLAAGDDTVQRNLDPDASIKAARFWGFSLKFVIRKRGESVDFLARHYHPAVWNGSTMNICSPLRTLSKFHVSTCSDLPPPIVAYMKATSILVNDAKTLLIGDWMRMIIKQTQPAWDNWVGKSAATLARLDKDRQWNDLLAKSFEGETNYQVGGDEHELDWQHAIFNLEFEPTKIDEFLEYLSNNDAKWDKPPVLLELEAKRAAQPYSCNGELVLPASPDIVVVADPAAPTDYPCINSNPHKQTGWFEGRPLCTARVRDKFRRCKECHAHFKVCQDKDGQRPAKAPAFDSAVPQLLANAEPQALVNKAPNLKLARPSSRLNKQKTVGWRPKQTPNKGPEAPAATVAAQDQAPSGNEQVKHAAAKPATASPSSAPVLDDGALPVPGQPIVAV